MDSSQKQVMPRVKTCYELVCFYISHSQKSVSLDLFKWKTRTHSNCWAGHDSIMSSHSLYIARDTPSPGPTFREEKLYVWEGDSVDGVCSWDVGWKSVSHTTIPVLLSCKHSFTIICLSALLHKVKSLELWGVLQWRHLGALSQPWWGMIIHYIESWMWMMKWWNDETDETNSNNNLCLRGNI